MQEDRDAYGGVMRKMRGFRLQSGFEHGSKKALGERGESEILVNRKYALSQKMVEAICASAVAGTVRLYQGWT